MDGPARAEGTHGVSAVCEIERSDIMPAWGWIVLAAAILAVLLIAWMVWSKRRTGRLRTAFGPEYEHTMTESGKRRAAESELTARRKRREALDIRPLAPA